MLPCKTSEILICFADRSESQVIRRIRPDLRLLHTGMGQENAKNALAKHLLSNSPAVIVSSGFAGGLNPSLTKGTVLFESETSFFPPQSLGPLSLTKGTFHSAEKVATTIEEKSALWQSTQCDAIEMESFAIKAIADSEGIPFLSLRVISDSAEEPLPLDFNQIMTPRMRISFPKLAWHLMKRPQLIPRLLRFNQSVKYAAYQLATAVSALIPEQNANISRDYETH